MGVLINICHLNPGSKSRRGYPNSNLEISYRRNILEHSEYYNTIITNMILKEIKYFLETKKFSNSITKKQKFIIKKLIQTDAYFVKNKCNLINNTISYH